MEPNVVRVQTEYPAQEDILNSSEKETRRRDRDYCWFQSGYDELAHCSTSSWNVNVQREML